MRSPFAIFRTYQKTLMVIVFGMAMISFVLMSPLSAGSDVPKSLAFIIVLAVVGCAGWVAGMPSGKSNEYGAWGVVLGALLAVVGTPAGARTPLLGGYLVDDGLARLFLTVGAVVLLGVALHVRGRALAAPHLAPGLPRFVALTGLFMAAANLALLANDLIGVEHLDVKAPAGTNGGPARPVAWSGQPLREVVREATSSVERSSGPVSV